MAGHVKGDPGWRKSSASGDECVEVRIGGDGVRIRDTKDRQGPILTFTHGEWHAFLTGVRRGEFDPPTG